MKLVPFLTLVASAGLLVKGAPTSDNGQPHAHQRQWRANNVYRAPFPHGSSQKEGLPNNSRAADHHIYSNGTVAAGPYRPRAHKVDYRVYNGDAVTESVPWFALLQIILTYPQMPNVVDHVQCGGTLINSRYVLTAAHCVSNFVTGGYVEPQNLPVSSVSGNDSATDEPSWVPNIMVQIGEKRNYLDSWYNTGKLPTDAGPSAVFRGVSEVLCHPDYHPELSPASDICVLKLDAPVANWPSVKLNMELGLGVRTAAEVAANEAAGQPVVTMGYGATSAGTPGTLSTKNTQLMVSKSMEIVSLDDCQQAWSAFLEENNSTMSSSATVNNVPDDRVICVGTAVSGSCGGDSGGPLLNINDNVQVGVVSRGVGCGDSSVPRVFTRISAFADFILKTAGTEGIQV